MDWACPARGRAPQGPGGKDQNCKRALPPEDVVPPARQLTIYFSTVTVQPWINHAFSSNE